MKTKWYKGFIFLVMFWLLCGASCDIKDEYKKYTDTVKDGISCTYEPYNKKDFYSDITNITFKADKEKIDITYNLIDGNSYTINYITFNFKKDGTIKGMDETKKHKLGDKYTLTYKDFSYINFLNNYTYKNSCPDSIFIDTNGDRVLETKYEDHYISFVLKGSNDESKPNNSCKNSNAILCKKYIKDTYLDGEVTIELGQENYYLDGEKKQGMYYYVYSDKGIAYSSDYGNGKDSSGAALGSYNYIIRESDWKLLFPTDNTFASDILLDEKVLFGSVVIHITVEGSQTTKDYADMADVDDLYDPPYTPEPDKESPPMNGEITEVEFCEEARVLKAFQIIGYVLLVIKILVPLLLIIFGTVDFAKATISSDDKSNKEALNSLVRRVIIGVVIFIIPTILNYGLILVDNALDTASKFSECTQCLLSPTSCTKANNYMNE